MILGEGGEKMSKSRGNVVNPNDIVDQYGADTMRLHIMFIGDFEKAVSWSNEAVKGSKRFLDRCWNLMDLASDSEDVTAANESVIHKTIRKVTQDIDELKMNTAIAALMTRTVALGFVTEEMDKVYNIVLAAQLAGIAATKAGVTGRDIDGAARKVIADAGYGKCFGHGYGHSLGLEIHEAPNCSPSNDRPMPAGAVSSAEPGIYLPDKFGVRIEDVTVITENGCEIITKSPKNLIIL